MCSTCFAGREPLLFAVSISSPVAPLRRRTALFGKPLSLSARAGMRLMILGYSSIAERRVIPAAAKVAAIDEISIASNSRPQPSGWPKAGRFFSDYETALRESDSDVVYLSLPNAMHEHWAMTALAAGKHVVVDKPAMITLQGSERAVKEARRNNRVLAEATVFGYHPQ